MPGGVQPPIAPRSYATYKSPYGPKYKNTPNLAGWTLKSASKLGFTLAGFGGVVGFFALFILSDVPRVKRDILSKIPVIGEHYVKDIPASDNYFDLEEWEARMSYRELVINTGSPKA